LISCSYSFLQGEKLSKVLKASGNEVEAFWPSMFAKALKGQNIDELLSAISSAPAVAAAPVGAAPVQAAAPAKEESILLNMSS
jgi:ribosomal protein L12E/L44/L45/RPP1/RPP2